MREIKFRAWDTERPSDGMHYGKENDCTIATNLFGQTYYCDFLNYNTGDSDHLDYVDNDRFILMQYTGLKDKNGKEIYEGDLVQEYFSSLKHKGRIQQVVWIQEDCCFGLKPSNPYDYTPLQYSDNREIIGDIHTTPKLLEKPK